MQGNNLNSFGDATSVGTYGFQQSLRRSIYRSQRDKRELICSDYPKILEECGGFVRDKKKGDVVSETTAVQQPKPKVAVTEPMKSEVVKTEPVLESKPKRDCSQKWECVVGPCDFIDKNGCLIED